MEAGPVLHAQVGILKPPLALSCGPFVQIPTLSFHHIDEAATLDQALLHHAKGDLLLALCDNVLTHQTPGPQLQHLWGHVGAPMVSDTLLLASHP